MGPRGVGGSRGQWVGAGAWVAAGGSGWESGQWVGGAGRGLAEVLPAAGAGVRGAVDGDADGGKAGLAGVVTPALGGDAGVGGVAELALVAVLVLVAARTWPMTRQRDGNWVEAGNVATREWSSPPVSTHSRAMGGGESAGTVRDESEVLPCRNAAASPSGPPVTSEELSRSSATPLASAMWPRSASRPSLTSIIAVAPSAAASGPAW